MSEKNTTVIRIRASNIHGKLEEYLGSFKIAPEVKRLYKLILEKKFASMNSQKETDLKLVQKELLELSKSLNSLNSKFVDDHLDQETYSRMKKEMDDKLIELKNRESQIKEQESDFSLYMRKGITLVDNLKDFYKNASLDVKQKIIGSIFPQNLVFNQNEYRTNTINEAFRLITKTINEIQGQKKQNATVSDSVFDYAPPPGLEPGTP
ncbi:MAG: hypothetical protein IPK10_18750 [Bacteroidetes bacterium]|nr:hypothetical protein [Bacteroidota bacterium]